MPDYSKGLLQRGSSSATTTFRRRERGEREEARDNLYADLQVPSVSNHGSTMATAAPAPRVQHRHHAPPPRPRPLAPPPYQAHRLGLALAQGGPAPALQRFQPSSMERAEV